MTNDELKEMLMRQGDHLNSDLKGIRASLSSIDATLVKQETQLTEHIRRTNLLETYVQERTKSQDGELALIHRHITKVQVVGWLTLVVTPLALAIYRAFFK